MLSTCLSQFSVAARTNGPAIVKMAVRAMSTVESIDRVIALCKANSEVLNRNIAVIDNLLDKHHLPVAQEIYTKKCPITGTTLGRQFRHELDHFEKVALDCLNTERDSKHQPIDLHYDRRERGTVIEKDICEARKRCIYIQDGTFSSFFASWDYDWTVTVNSLPCPLIFSSVPSA